MLQPYVLSPIDLAIGKMVRFNHQDREDVLDLFEAGLFTIEEFEKLSSEAIEYFVGSQNFIKLNIQETINDLKKIELNKETELNEEIKTECLKNMTLKNSTNFTI